MKTKFCFFYKVKKSKNRSYFQLSRNDDGRIHMRAKSQPFRSGNSALSPLKSARGTCTTSSSRSDNRADNQPGGAALKRSSRSSTVMAKR